LRLFRLGTTAVAGWINRTSTLRTFVFVMNACALGPFWRDACLALHQMGTGSAVGLPLGHYGTASFCLGSGLAGLALRPLMGRNFGSTVGASVLYPIVGSMAFATFYAFFEVAFGGRDGALFVLPLIAWLGPIVAAPYAIPLGGASVIALWPVARWSMGLPVITVRRCPSTSP
jgi:hypothetical protein